MEALRVWKVLYISGNQERFLPFGNIGNSRGLRRSTRLRVMWNLFFFKRVKASASVSYDFVLTENQSWIFREKTETMAS